MRTVRLPLVLAVLWNAGPPPAATGGEPVRVMSFNLWHGGDAERQPLAQTVAVIKAVRADIVGLQETDGQAPGGQARPDNSGKIARELGWHHLAQRGRTAILSRFPIVAATPRKWGAKLELPSGRPVYVFNAHLAHAPYQPYQLLRIPYANAPFLRTADEAVAAARSGQVERLLAEVAAVSSEKVPVFLTGDFNEPSHRDWTAGAAKVGQCPLAVPWPSTAAVEAAGFADAYRSVYPDPVKHPGLTWTPTTEPNDPNDRHDRIDFVFVRGATVKTAEVVGESKGRADIVVAPYPSDHRAVVAGVDIPNVGGDPKKGSRK